MATKPIQASTAAALWLACGLALAQGDALGRAANEPGAVKTDTGLVYRVLKEGQGPQPQATDRVRVHYRGTFVDGKEFDSSYQRGQPTEFPLNRVIKCWTEGVQRMKVGTKAKLTCPPSIAYGERGAGGVIPPNAVLQFEVELLAIVPPGSAAPHPPSTPQK
jgi:FKBP-type peptidyl-prolyl cis-trans isomerase FkpA